MAIDLMASRILQQNASSKGEDKTEIVSISSSYILNFIPA